MSTRYLFPQSDSASSYWYIVAGSGALWQCVNDTAGDAAAATAASVSDGGTTRILFTGSNGTGTYLAGLDGDLSPVHATVTSITVRVYASKQDPGSPRYRIVVNSNGTTAAGEWITDTVVENHAHTFVLETDPATGAAWTPAAVNALAIGMEIDSAYAAMHFSTLECEVAYTVVNSAPVASDATLDVPFETPVYGELTATDDDDDALTFAIASAPDHGAVELNSETGEYTYTPEDGYSGEDTFAFTANDGYDDSNTGTITITVDDAPPANPPTGDWTYTQGCQLLVVDATGITAGEGEEIVAVSWQWGDATANGAGVTTDHPYSAGDTYPVACIIRYAGGELFSFPKNIEITPLQFTADVIGNFALVDAGDNTPPTGFTIDAYTWTWEDGTPGGSGVAVAHRYTEAGSYLIILTVTIAGHAITASEEVHIMADTVTSGLQADTNQHLILDAGAIILHYGEVGLERVLGATRGGTRFTLGRTIRPMEADGALGPVKGMRRRDTVAPVITVPMLDMKVENVLAAIAGADSSEEGETTVIVGGEVADADYIANVAMSCRYSGSNDPLILVLKNVLITGPFDLQTADKNEPVVELTFEAHFDPATPRTEPWEIIHPQQTASGS